MEILRNMWRRRLRTSLTIFGIVIGIFAFTVMGSMAEKINKLIGGALDYYGTAINIQAGGGHAFASGAFDASLVDQLRRVPGVNRVDVSVDMLLKDPREQGMSFGPPNLLMGVEVNPSFVRRFKEQSLVISQGRQLASEDRRKVVVGADLADEFDLVVGSTLSIRGEPFLVKGIVERTLQFADRIAFVPIADARALLAKDVPLLKTANVVTGAQVFPKPGVDPDQLAARINRDLPAIHAFPPTEFRRQFEAGTVIFNLIIFGVALIAVIVGGLSVINTMIMSVSERTREIGIKRAVGAKTRHILYEYIYEAGLIGLFGGLIGFSLGWALTLLINIRTRSSGTILFTMTGRLALGALAFSVLLGCVAGLYPAIRAARMDPVKALRAL